MVSWGQALVSTPWSWFKARKQSAYRRVLNHVDVPLLPSQAFKRDRVVVCNNALAWGGAERQIVATLTGLVARGVEDVSLLCEHMDGEQDHDFFLWRLKKAGISVDVVRRLVARRDIKASGDMWNLLHNTHEMDR